MIDGDLKDRLDVVLDAKRASLVTFTERMIELFLDQEDLTQSMLLGQVKADDGELVKLMLLRLADRKGKVRPSASKLQQNVIAETIRAHEQRAKEQGGSREGSRPAR